MTNQKKPRHRSDEVFDFAADYCLVAGAGAVAATGVVTQVVADAANAIQKAGETIFTAAVGIGAASFATVGSRATSRRGWRGDSAGHKAVAGDRFFVGDADANRTGGLGRDLLRFVSRVFLHNVLGHALVGADLDLLFTAFLFADRNFAFDSFGHANFFADGDRAVTVLGAADPMFDRMCTASSGAAVGLGSIWAGRLAGISASAAVIVTMAAEEAAEPAADAAEEGRNFFAFPVAETDQLLLHDGFFNVLVAGLVDDPVFIDGHIMHDLTDLFFDHLDAFGDAYRAFFTDWNAFGLTDVVRFRATLHFVGCAFGCVRFTNHFRTADGTVRWGRRRRPTGIATIRRPEISPYGRNRYGGNDANQQCETKRLAHHAFSLVIHADPVFPDGPPAGFGSTTVMNTHY